jgi:hypothetical protein
MGEMAKAQSAAPLRAIFDAARRFGLTEDEAWQAFDDALAGVGTDATVHEYLEELTGELAPRILGVSSREARVASRDRL